MAAADVGVLVGLLVDNPIVTTICKGLIGEEACGKINWAKWIINKLTEALELFGILECRDTTSAGCLAHFMELITRATLKMFERFGQDAATEFARSIYELMNIIAKQDPSSFALQWASIGGSYHGQSNRAIMNKDSALSS